MKLYEIDNEIQKLIDGAVDPETGEVVMDLSALESLQMERENKLESIALGIKNLTAEAAAIREEEKKLAARRQAMESRTERLKKFLAEALDGEKLETARVRVRVQKNPDSVDYDDVLAIMDYANAHEISWMDLGYIHRPDEFNKRALKQALKQYPDLPVTVKPGGWSLRIV